MKTKIQAQYLIDSEIYTLLPGGQSETAAKGPIAKSARKYYDKQSRSQKNYDWGNVDEVEKSVTEAMSVIKFSY